MISLAFRPKIIFRFIYQNFDNVLNINDFYSVGKFLIPIRFTDGPFVRLRGHYAIKGETCTDNTVLAHEMIKGLLEEMFEFD